MSSSATQLTLRQRIETTLLLHPGRGVALTRLYELLPGAATIQVRQRLKDLTKAGRVIRHGTIRYPTYQLVRAGDPLHRPAAASVAPAHSQHGQPKDQTAARPSSMTWPDAVQVQRLLTSVRSVPFSGIDWAAAMSRPGCQDHLLVPSRRGDVRVQHRGPMGICGARKHQNQTERGQP